MHRPVQRKYAAEAAYGPRDPGEGVQLGNQTAEWRSIA